MENIRYMNVKLDILLSHSVSYRNRYLFGIETD